ncbi:MAG: RNA polymerase sigma factor [bacterium]|nr:RNA polymerase sigma factor [bacterium]MCM1374743.1 RNA polymerase sigma factor [Muribaculum sp.]
MKRDEAIKLLSDQQFLDKLYAYAYQRCNTSHEAEDLCSDIILTILKALRHSGEIEHFHAFSWTVAHRVYADYCERKKRDSARLISMEALENDSREFDNSIANRMGKAAQSMAADSAEDIVMDAFKQKQQEERLAEIFREISFLSLTYRRVTVMYYLEGHKISDIAGALGLTETAVKQRLFVARRTIRTMINSGPEQADTKQRRQGDDTMNLNHTDPNRTLQPVALSFIGNGDPVGNNPSDKAERILSQNLVYLCRRKAKTAAELARELDVPMPYIEQELEIQQRGANGVYGLLQRTAQDKYLANILVVDREEYLAANDIYRKHTDAVCRCLTDNVEHNRKRLLSLAQLCGLSDCRLLLWPLLYKVILYFREQVQAQLRTLFPDVAPSQRPYTTVAIADAENIPMLFYGCNSIHARQLCGYSDIYVENLSGKRLQLHFGCDHNISSDPVMLLTIRCAGGLRLSSLSDGEQEIAARAIQCGYLLRDGDTLIPAIVVLFRDTEADHKFRELLRDLQKDIHRQAPILAEELAGFMKKHIPPHLTGDYPCYNSSVASCSFFHDVAEECIGRGILNAPKSPLGPEGVLMVLTK